VPHTRFAVLIITDPLSFDDELPLSFDGLLSHAFAKSRSEELRDGKSAC
jgi:hypothetical protein